ncbi:pyridoxal-dependent decarboxylase [Streptosporangium lutulentum]
MASEEDVVEKPDWAAPLAEAYERSLAYLTALPDRPVGSVTSAPDLRAALDGPLPEAPADPREVIAGLAAAAESGLVGTQSGRFFGFVVGGANPAALAADWLTTVWDQNACLFALAPAASMVEEVAGKWLIQLLGLPAHASAGFVTGGQMANFTALAAARHEMLRRQGGTSRPRGWPGRPACVCWPGATA